MIWSHMVLSIYVSSDKIGYILDNEFRIYRYLYQQEGIKHQRYACLCLEIYLQAIIVIALKSYVNGFFQFN